MGTLRDQLAKNGLVSERTVRELEAQAEIDATDHALTLKTTRVVGIEELRVSATRGAFRRSARVVLTQDPHLVADVVRLAHRLPHDGSREHKRFIRDMLALRDELGACPAAKDQQAAIRRHFRK